MLQTKEIGENKTLVELNDEEVRQFILFRQFHPQIEALLHDRVFEVRNGKVELIFDPDGNIKEIRRFFVTYFRKRS